MHFNSGDSDIGAMYLTALDVPPEETVKMLDPLSSQMPPQGPCYGCKTAILDRYFLMVADQCFHSDCLKCCICFLPLDRQTSCFFKDGAVFCREDYTRQFRKHCSRCLRPLDHNDLVMRAKECIYHVQCFNCIICSSPLQPGEWFALGDNGALYCQGHYEPLIAMAVEEQMTAAGSSAATAASAAAAAAGGDCGAVSAAVAAAAKQRKKRKLKQHQMPIVTTTFMGSGSVGTEPHRFDSPGMFNLLGGDCDGGGSDGDTPGPSGGRSKRMRTSFKHHQLRTMKTYFALNHNPDAKDLKQLAQKTGLTKRVLQVWFQNARAKYRRANQIKTGSEGNDGVIGSLNASRSGTVSDDGATMKTDEPLTPKAAGFP